MAWRAVAGCLVVAMAAGCGSSGGGGSAGADAGGGAGRDAGSEGGALGDGGPGDGGRDSSAEGGSTPDGGSSDAAATDAAADAGGASAVRPVPRGIRWFWQLQGTVDPDRDVDLYDVDLFDAPDELLASLRARGVQLVCYFSAGSFEEWRPDAGDFPAEALGNPLDGWPGERWLDVRHRAVRRVLAARLDLAARRGCDGVEPDNVDGYANDTGFALSRADSEDFLRWLAEEAHRRGLSVGLKNAPELVPSLVERFDWALNEQCLRYDECDAYAPFLAAGKAVLHVEYTGSAEALCRAAPAGFSSVRANLELDGRRWQPCW